MPRKGSHTADMEMKGILEKFTGYLRFERNASPETVEDYGGDLRLFQQFLTPPGERTLPLHEVDHLVIREFVGWLLDRGLQKTTIARKLAALRTFFKFCVREKYTKQNPARLVSTPKLPKRLPRILTAEEMSGFRANRTGGPSVASAKAAGLAEGKAGRRKRPMTPRSEGEAKLILKRDRAIL